MADLRYAEDLDVLPPGTLCIGDSDADDVFEVLELPHNTGHSSFECDINIMPSCTA